MPNRILILFAHPLFEKSNANAALVNSIPESENITFHDLYQEYPDFDINMQREQELLLMHDIIIWHHPMYWYSCPPLLKQWIDIVLEHGWAYGKGGAALKGKKLLQTITTGGNKHNYSTEGRDRNTILQLLEPFRLTANVCHIDYLPPFVVHGTHAMNDEEYNESANEYGKFLEVLEHKIINPAELFEFSYCNDWLATKLT